MGKKVSVIGAAIIDVIAKTVNAQVFEKGSLPMEHIKMTFGGDALNEAVIMKRLGMEVELISKVGKDESGYRVLDFLQNESIECSIAVEEGLETGVNIVLVDESGQRHFLTNPQSSLRKLGEKDVMPYLPEAAEIVCMASIFVSPQLDIPSMERVFSKIKEKPNRILVADMTKAKNGETLEDIEKLLTYVDYLIPNEEEAALLTKEKNPEASAKRFLQAGAKCVIIKCGDRGCYIATEDEQRWVPAYDKCKVADTTGAGDSFVAGFVTALSQKKTLVECGTYACAVASCVVEQVGGGEAFHAKDLVKKRYVEMNERGYERK